MLIYKLISHAPNTRWLEYLKVLRNCFWINTCFFVSLPFHLMSEMSPIVLRSELPFTSKYHCGWHVRETVKASERERKLVPFFGTAPCTWDAADSYHCWVLSLVTELPEIIHKVLSASEPQQVQWTKATRAISVEVSGSWVRPSSLASRSFSFLSLCSVPSVIWRCYLLCLFQRIMLSKCDCSWKKWIKTDLVTCPRKVG